jgi:hypothetical protein
MSSAPSRAAGALVAARRTSAVVAPASIHLAASRSADQARRARATPLSAGWPAPRSAPPPTAALPSLAASAQLSPPTPAALQRSDHPARLASRQSPVAARAATSPDKARTTHRTRARNSCAPAGRAASGRTAAPPDRHCRAAYARPRSVQSSSRGAAFLAGNRARAPQVWGTVCGENVGNLLSIVTQASGRGNAYGPIRRCYARSELWGVCYVYLPPFTIRR